MRAHRLAGVAQNYLVMIIHLGIAGLNAPQASPHFEASFSRPRWFFHLVRGVPAKDWPPRLRIVARFSSFGILPSPRSATPGRDATMRKIVFHGRYILQVAIERFIAQREAFSVDDERDHHRFTVGAMIARIAALHNRGPLGGTLQIAVRT